MQANAPRHVGAPRLTGLAAPLMTLASAMPAPRLTPPEAPRDERA